MWRKCAGAEEKEKPSNFNRKDETSDQPAQGLGRKKRPPLRDSGKTQRRARARVEELPRQQGQASNKSTHRKQKKEVHALAHAVADGVHAEVGKAEIRAGFPDQAAELPRCALGGDSRVPAPNPARPCGGAGKCPAGCR